MADGDITKRLTSEIRDALNDNNRIFVKSDITFYNLLNKYQLEFMTRYLTTEAYYNLTMVTGTLTYYLNKRVHKIIEFRSDDSGNDDADDDSVAEGVYVPETHTLLFVTDSFTNAEVITVRAYIKPDFSVEDEDGEEKTSDKIDEDTDPIIGENYYEYLKEACLAHFRNEVQGFRSLRDVRRDVKDLAYALRGTLRVPSHQNLLGRINF